MKNLKTLKLIATIAIGAIAASSATAAPINGDININGSGTLNNTGISDATQLTNITAAVGAGSTGDYAGIAVNTSVTIKDLDWGSVNYTGAKAITDFWSINNGQYTFDLITITYNQVAGGTLTIQGTGTAKSTEAGIDSYTGYITLSSSSAGTSISFTSSTSVPDSGHTAALLGLGMLGLAGFARRLRK